METLQSIQQLIAEGSAYIRLRPFLNDRGEEPGEIILENRIWMPSVRTQDDIFEGDPRFRWTEEPISREGIVLLARKFMRGASEAQIKQHADLIMGRVLDPQINAEMRAGIEQELSRLYRRSSILSFFKDPQVQAYWAQYADRGRGYGLIFDFSEPWRFPIFEGFEDTEVVPFPVNYVRALDRPAIDLHFSPMDRQRGFEDLEKGLLTKDVHWCEQHEERLIRCGIAAGHVEFPSSSLRAVVLGYVADEQRDLSILNAVQARRDELLVLRAVEDRNTFNLRLATV